MVSDPPGGTRAADLTGIILAGGRSTRFGSDKASALLRGRPLLAHVTDALAPLCGGVVVVQAAGQHLPPIGVPVEVVTDTYEALGPLAGIVTGLAAATSELAFVVSTDAPLLQPALVTFLADRARSSGADIVCPRVNGYPQPLVCVYRVPRCLTPFRVAVERGDLKITAAYEGLRTLFVDEGDVGGADPGLLSFQNANTPEALAAIADLLPPGD